MKKIAGLSILFAAGIAAAQAPTTKTPTAPAPAKAPTATTPPAKGPAAPPAGIKAPDPVAPPAGSTTSCYELSKDGKAWSKTPERMCVGTGDKNVEIKLQTGMPTPTDVAVFHLDLKTRAKCIDCNKDVFALLNPENSVMNQLAITFNGKRDVKTGTETGTLTVGKTKFFYRKN